MAVVASSLKFTLKEYEMTSTFLTSSDPKELIDKLFEFPKGTILKVVGKSQGRLIRMAAAVLETTLLKLQQQDHRYAEVAIVKEESGDVIYLTDGIHPNLKVIISDVPPQGQGGVQATL